MQVNLPVDPKDPTNTFQIPNAASSLIDNSVVRRTNSAAQNSLGCLGTIVAALKHVFKWLASIPSKIVELFKKCFSCVPKQTTSLPLSLDKIDPKVVQGLLESFEVENFILESAIMGLKFDSVKDYKQILNLKFQLNQNELHEELYMIATSDHKIKLDIIKKSREVLEGALENKLQENASSYEIIRKAYDGLIAIGKIRPSPYQEPLKLSDFAKEDAKTLALIKSLTRPPSYKNDKNNCWFHSTLELLWTWGLPFSELIKKKTKELDDLKDLEIKHDYEKHPKYLLNALKAYMMAMDTGNIELIRSNAENVQQNVMQTCKNLNQVGRQQDAAEFLQFILSFLTEELSTDKNPKPNPFFEIETTREELGKKIGAKKQVYNPQPMNFLHLDIHDKTSFSDILKANFEKIENTNPNNTAPINGFQISHYSEQQKIIGTPPAFIFVQMKRFDFPSEEVLAMDPEIKKAQEDLLITQTAKDLMKQYPYLFTDFASAKVGAIGQLEHDHDELPGNPVVQKISTHIEFPKDLKVNWGPAFGEKTSNDPYYNYVLRGAIIHEGESSTKGHYTAAVVGTNPSNGKKQWFECNDVGSKVDPVIVDKARDIAGDAYIFYWERVQKETPRPK
jgi:ubiquitin C-terminal hydrolase